MFCFKQKTAYEMRISDWSSDVCSSDLSWAAPLGRADLSAFDAALAACSANAAEFAVTAFASRASRKRRNSSVRSAGKATEPLAGSTGSQTALSASFGGVVLVSLDRNSLEEATRGSVPLAVVAPRSFKNKTIKPFKLTS